MAIIYRFWFMKFHIVKRERERERAKQKERTSRMRGEERESIDE